MLIGYLPQYVRPGLVPRPFSFSGGGATVSEVITIRTDIRKARRKHREHISGAGAHDSRPKRLRTRAAKVKHEVDSWS